MSAKHSVQASTSVMGALRDGLRSAGDTSCASGIHDSGNISFISTKSSAWILATSGEKNINFFYFSLQLSTIWTKPFSFRYFFDMQT